MFSLQNRTYEECIITYQKELLYDITEAEKGKNLSSLSSIIVQINSFKLELENYYNDIKTNYNTDYDEIKNKINSIFEIEII